MMLQELIFLANFFEGKIVKFSASNNSAVIEYSDEVVTYCYSSGIWRRVD